MQPEPKKNKLQRTAEKYKLGLQGKGGEQKTLKDIELQIRSASNTFACVYWLSQTKILKIIFEKSNKNLANFPGSSLQRIIALVRARQPQFIQNMDKNLYRTYQTPILQKHKQSLKSLTQKLFEVSQKNSERQNKFRQLTYSIYEIQNKFPSQQQKTELLFTSNKELFNFQAKIEDDLEEFWYNEVRLYTDYLKKKIGLEYPCCKLLCRVNEQVASNYAQKYQYTQYFCGCEKIPLQNDDVIKIKKQVIGFLNGSGGIVYFGFKKLVDQQKIRVKGIKIHPLQLKDKLNSIVNQILQQICPSHSQFKYVQQIQKLNLVKDSIKINTYIELSYDRVFDAKELHYFSQEGECFFYIIRIEVQPGHPREIYHLLNPETQNIEGFFFENIKKQQGKIITQSSFEEFLEKFYKKQEKADQQTHFEYPPFHIHCRIKLSSFFDESQFQDEYESSFSSDFLKNQNIN